MLSWPFAEDAPSATYNLPGSTGSRFRGGWEEFLSDVVESAGAATPQMLMTVATGGYSAATQGAARSLLLGRAVTGLQVGSTTLGSYGNNVANADGVAKDLRELAKGIEYEFPEEAAKIRAEADSIEKYRRWTAAGRAVVDAAVDRILPEETMALKPGVGGFLRRQASAQVRNFAENGLGNGAGQVYDNIAYGTPIDPKKGAYDTATGTVANAPMTGVGAARGRAQDVRPGNGVPTPDGTRTDLEPVPPARQPGTPRLQFSRPGDDEVLSVHKRLSEGEDAFQFGKTKPDTKSMQELAAAFSLPESQLKVTEVSDNHGKITYEVTTPKGVYKLVADFAKGTVQGDSTKGNSNTTKAGGGAQVYQLALTFAHNNGLKLRPDSSISVEGQKRRISHMISSILRHKTSDHIDGHTEFFDPETMDWKVSIPDWKTGDHDHNLALLLRKEHEIVTKEAAARGIDISYLTHDPTTNNIINGHTGRPLTEGDFKSLVDRFDPGDSGVGASTLARAIVTGSALRGPGSGSGVRPVHENQGGNAGGNPDGEPDKRLVSVARHLYYSRPPEGAGGVSAWRMADAVSQRPGGLTAAIAETTRLLNQQQPGLVHEKTHIFSSAEEFLNSDYARSRGFTEDQVADIRDAEGFFDEDTGVSVIIAGNARVRPGESPEQALKRVIVHERIGHDGMNLLLDSDADAAERWDRLLPGIPKTELAAIRTQRGYEHTAKNNRAAALEWFARKVGDNPRILDSEPLLRQMWETLKHSLHALYTKIGLGNEETFKSRDFDRELQQLMARARRQAVQPAVQPAVRR